MKNFDYRHIAFHTLIALYFIWFIIFGILIAMVSGDILSKVQAEMAGMLISLMLFNFLIGAALFIVIRMFRNRTVLTKVITYSYILISVVAIITLIINEIK